MHWLVRLGLIELAVGGLLGWAMLVKVTRPEVLDRIGLKNHDTIRQSHLDYVFMGLILCAVGLVAPSTPNWIAAPLAFGTVMNPALFFPPAFKPDIVRKPWYIALNLLSFIGTSGGLVAVAIRGPG